MTTEYVKPETIADACAARAEHPDYVVLAGGTDYMVGVHHRGDPPGVIDVFGLEGLGGIDAQGDAIRIGAGTTYAEILRSELVREHLPSLRACAQEVGAVQIQERGTLGGNMATSSPVGDTLPVLLALDAQVVLGSVDGERRVPYETFCTGYRQTVMQPNELILAVEIPRPAQGLVQFWRKVGTRKAQAISKVMVAGSALLDADGAVSHVRLAMGAVADRPVRLRQTEALIQGQQPSEQLAERVHQEVLAEIVPITDVRSTKGYRLSAAANLAARFVRELIELI